MAVQTVQFVVKMNCRPNLQMLKLTIMQPMSMSWRVQIRRPVNLFQGYCFRAEYGVNPV